MKYLKLITPIILLLLASSCKSPTDPGEDPPNNDKQKIEITIVNPSNGSTFEQTSNIPCEADLSVDSLADQVTWKLSGTTMECENNSLIIADALQPGDYTLTAEVHDPNYETGSDKVDITVNQSQYPPKVEITLPNIESLYQPDGLSPKFNGFVYAENTNIWVKAEATDNDGNELSAQIEWSVNGTVVATSYSNEEASFEALPSYDQIIAKVTNADGVSDTDTLSVQVHPHILAFMGREGNTGHSSEWNNFLVPFSRAEHPMAHESGKSKYRANASISPNGRYTAYIAPGSCGSSSVFIADYDFSNPQEVDCDNFDGNAYTPRFFPDSKKIAFTGRWTAPGELNNSYGAVIADVETGETRRVPTRTCEANEGIPQNTPCWRHFDSGRLTITQDGSIITTIKKQTELKENHAVVAKINPNTGNITPIWEDDGDKEIGPAAWDVSPNGKWITLTIARANGGDHLSSVEYEPRIAIIKTDGSMGQPRYLSPPAQDIHTFQPEPDFPVFIDNETVCHLKENDTGTLQCRDLQGNLVSEKSYSFQEMRTVFSYPNFEH